MARARVSSRRVAANAFQASLVTSPSTSTSSSSSTTKATNVRVKKGTAQGRRVNAPKPLW